MDIYYQPHKSRQREAVFFKELLTVFPECIHIRQNYRIGEGLLNNLIHTRDLIGWLENDRLLPRTKVNLSIELLRECPEQIKIALAPTRITCDFVVIENRQPIYIEFHEEQHRKLTISRPKKVYTPNGEPIEVPRFLQRLIKDVWRALNFRPYTIVWSDWFAQNKASGKIEFDGDIQEYHLPGRFSFMTFCEI